MPAPVPEQLIDNAQDASRLLFFVAALVGIMFSLLMVQITRRDHRAAVTEGTEGERIATETLYQMELILTFVAVAVAGVAVSAWLYPGQNVARNLILACAMLAVGFSAVCRWIGRRRFNNAQRRQKRA